MNKKIFLFLTTLLITTALWSQDYDYRWTSSDSIGGPTYSWEDTSSSYTTVPISGDDDNSGDLPIGFTFNYYGTDYTSFKVCTNGWISFTNNTGTFNNQLLPNLDSPENIIAPLWDDLHFRSTNKAYYYSDGSKLVVSFLGVDTYNAQINDTLSFQVIFASNGSILFQYQKLTNLNTLTPTVGWQDLSRTQGASIVFNTTNRNRLHEDLAISITDINAGIQPPRDLAAVGSYQQADLSWTASTSENIGNYLIYRGTGTGDITKIDSVSGTTITYSDSGLTNGTTYYYGSKNEDNG